MSEQPIHSPDPVSAALALCPDEALAPLSGADQEAAALAAIVLIEQLKARLDALAVSAWRGLYAGYAREAAERLVPLVEAARAGAAVRGSLPGPAALRAQAAAAVRGGVVAEVMAATGLPEGECWRRLRLATAEPARSEGLIAMLAAGEADLARVARLCDEISELDAEEAGEVALRVVAPCRDGSVASHALVGRRLRRALAQHRADDPAAAAKHAERAKRARRTSAELFDDGTGVVRIVGEAARVCSVMSRIDALARGLRAGGGYSEVTLDQLRSDVAFELLMRGDGRVVSDRPESGPTPVGDGASIGAASLAPAAVVGTAPLIPGQRFGAAPPAHVDVIVTLATLLGCDDEPGELPGFGFVSASHVRQIAHAAGSVWRRLVVDDRTGALIEVSTHRYRPTEAMRTHVAARDRVCRGPGCQVSPIGADLDHDVPWPAGESSAANLSVKHRRHHQLKTFGLWSTRQDPETASVTWTTLAGRSYVTEPHDYLDGRHAGAWAAHAVSTRHTDDPADDPPPF
ncbi:MAG: hypothetical protein BWY91_02468 [bacterium ADurb.BinA028]|nr:MAG: hypothetical protein BWY91_02468 [bacterium ADurb.BinA028]HNV14164.1 HNH endonuclease signature motif containing protein [Dermatophilaceae bacterium]